jgi:predicted SprT family Zn-dependent metalloprotease
MRKSKIDILEYNRKLEIINNLACELWDYYIEVYPELITYDAPIIEFNNRFTATAGMCYWHENRIELGYKFFSRNSDAMLKEILPHELAHQIDYNLNGPSSENSGHGETWASIMENIGLPAKRYHQLKV